MMSFWPAVLLSAFTLSAHAKPFKNSFLTMEIPDSWSCATELNAWVCSSSISKESKEAMIVLAAKVAAPEDNLKVFYDQLKKPKTIPTTSGAPMPSKVSEVRYQDLAGAKWVRAQHLGSEIADFYTLYLTTVKDQLAVHITFSAQRPQFQKYKDLFERAINSIQLLAPQDLPLQQNQTADPSGVIGMQTTATTPPAPLKKKSGAWPLIVVGLALGLVLAVAASIFMTGRKKISRRKSKKTHTQ